VQKSLVQKDLEADLLTANCSMHGGSLYQRNLLLFRKSSGMNGGWESAYALLFFPKHPLMAAVGDKEDGVGGPLVRTNRAVWYF